MRLHMSRHLRQPGCVLICVVPVLLATGGCYGDAIISVKGTVVDTQERPVPKAKAELYFNSESTPRQSHMSSDEGTYRLFNTYAPSFGRPKIILVVEKTGFRRYSEELDASKAYHENHKIILRPEDSAAK